MVDINTNPLYFAAAGGVLLGVATSLNYCLRGKVTGMSGIVDGIFSCKKGKPFHIQRNYLKSCPLLEACFSLQEFSLISFSLVLRMASRHLVRGMKLLPILPMWDMQLLDFWWVLALK